MNAGASSDFSRLYQAFSEQGAIKTWSLIVTVFGDLAPNKGDMIDSRTLGDICEVFEIKPEALRVALHRLRRDGWLLGQKRGRRSAYFLSDMGRASTAEAYERIYRQPRQRPSTWFVSLVEPNTEAQDDALALGPNCHVSPSRLGEFGFEARFEAVPRWMKDQAARLAGADDLVNFAKAMARLGAPKESLTPAQQLCLRLLILHYWRRLLLRTPDAPELLLGRDWPGFDARIHVARAFEALEKPSLEALAAMFEPAGALG